MSFFKHWGESGGGVTPWRGPPTAPTRLRALGRVPKVPIPVRDPWGYHNFGVKKVQKKGESVGRAVGFAGGWRGRLLPIV